MCLIEPTVYKYYVDVATLIKADGSMTPMAMAWQGKIYQIDKVTEITHTYCRAGGCGYRYTCRFGSDSRYLYWERNKWFLESQKYYSNVN